MAVRNSDQITPHQNTPKNNKCISKTVGDKSFKLNIHNLNFKRK